MAQRRINLRLKAILPVAGVLLAGILTFVWITLSPQTEVFALLESLYNLDCFKYESDVIMD